MKRICLFAAYSKNGTVADYVLFYLQALAKLADVYYLADCPMKEEELAKLTPYVKKAWAYRHEKYDFGSWQEIVRQIGWDQLAKYDECIFCNDSCFGPLFDLTPIVNAASADPETDAWAMQYFGSYFWCLKRKVFTSQRFKTFLENVKKQPRNEDVIHEYEDKLPPLLKEGGFRAKVFLHIPADLNNGWKTYILHKFPFLKIRVFTQTEKYRQRQWLPGWRAFLRAHTDYDPALIERHLASLGIPPDRFDTFAFRLKSLLWGAGRSRKRMFRIHLEKKHKIIVLFGMTLLSKTDFPRIATLPKGEAHVCPPSQKAD